jgi:hypothetical protein
VLAVCCRPDGVADRVDAGVEGDVVVWRWGSVAVGRDSAWDVDLAFGGWDLRVVAPVLPAGLAVLGDPSRYATVGRNRLAGITATDDGARFTVLGAGERVEVLVWAPTAPAASAWTTAGRVDLPVEAAGELWRVVVEVPSAGWVDVTLAATGS